MNTPIPLDTVILKEDFPISGVNIIEASAGTGKTYCIQTLYLRMVIECGFPVQTILVVTFTESAAHELRDRLHRILEKCRLFLNKQLPEDDDTDRIQKICTLPLKGRMSNEVAIAERLHRVEQALLDFDEAAIHTIHGFCKRVLQRFAFECGQSFDTSIVGKEDEILDEACHDIWRNETYGDPKTIVLDGFSKHKLISICVTLSQLKKLAKVKFSKPDALIRPTPPKNNNFIEVFGNTLKEFIENWNGEAITEVLVPLKTMKKLTQDENKAKTILNSIQKNKMLSNEIWKALESFATSKLKKNCDDSKFQPFRSACEHLVEQQVFVKIQLALKVVELSQKRKAEQNQQTYDDLIFDLRTALKNSEQSEQLTTVLRKEYRATLIDEFQDTDPVQYDNFRTIFVEKNTHPVFFVGDPKQAIYAFRGGDIFTYYTASKTKNAKHYTLDTNFRSEEKLVEAVNVIFKGRFKTEHIRFDGLIHAHGKDAGASLLENQTIDSKPFRIWHYDIYDNHKIGPESDVFRPVYRDIAAEICRLTCDKNMTLKGRRLRPSDFAVLVMRHAEGDLVRRELAALNIPAVQQSSDTIFDSDEATELSLLLEAMAEPTRLVKLRSALVTDLFDLTDVEIMEMMEGKIIREHGGNSFHQFQNYVKCFEESRRCWEHGSLIRAFETINQKFQIRTHLLSEPNGERRLTNLLHLLELTHQAEKNNHLGILSTVEWLARQRNEESRDENEAFEGRLESDDHAVKIMTTFKSKGLQFPIVFLPTLGLRQPQTPKEYCLYHEKSIRTGETEQWDLILDVSQSEKEKSEKENIEENIRLFYVGATRAEHRTYLSWGRFCNPSKDQSPLSEVLREKTFSDKEYSFEKEKEYCSLWHSDNGPVSLEKKSTSTFPDSAEEPSKFNEMPSVDPAELLTYQHRNEKVIHIDKSYRHTSYTELTPAHQEKSDGRVAFDEPNSIITKKSGLDIFSFESGAKTGTCWHSIFEQLDFSLFNESNYSHHQLSIRDKIGEILERFQLCTGRNDKEILLKKNTVAKMVHYVLTTPLPITLNSDEKFQLCTIGKADRRAEMGFDFPLHHWDKSESTPSRNTDAIVAVLQRHWGKIPERKPFLKALWNWHKEIPQGFMNGSIDLLFRVNNRYYLLDWKSNSLNGNPDDFNEEGLHAEMAHYVYFLQYLIYTVATHHYLKNRLPNYDYEQHFGGVYYLFVRGIDPSVPGRGIYFDRPTLVLIEELSAALGEFKND